MKRPPNRKLAVVVALMVVAASAVFARPAEHGRGEAHATNLIMLKGR